MFRTAGLDGAVARLRFSGLTELVRQAVPSHRGEFEVGGGRGGIVTYDIPFTPTRRIGWQFQDRQLRYFIALAEEGLRGKGLHDKRASVVESQYQSFFNHADVAAVLGDALKPYAKAVWLRFDPDFVYRYRPVAESVSTTSLVEALVVMTPRVDRFAEEFHDLTSRPSNHGGLRADAEFDGGRFDLGVGALGARLATRRSQPGGSRC